MPDQLNKQTLINLLIDSPLREPIKINLIDIANNTTDPDLPKIFPTIVKELEIFQKATDRRMKLAEETIAKLGGSAPIESPTPPQPPEVTPPSAAVASAQEAPAPEGLTVPPLDLPPLPQIPNPTPEPAMPTPQPVGGTPSTPNTPNSDESALAEIQKELDSLKSGVTTDANPTPAPTPTQT
ncbi:TPA: hypothetical protein DD448_03330 [Candidatus Collierbacteria bacterium]|uniref:Uncharacterized protein n=2 Tax=Candidatus Collieribacteriota TaxID=1752725 RepID=A0A1F5FZJ9_9BACT|nr:MAG: hypothetical protein UX32_C0003G0012 [Microgenomates group bacterium GW2011_GWF1_46_12]KKU28093.1 MAG: hypothetical protein UX40_C0003G0040 [Microgenomates group bacterium GW2011_GWF2_46_18]KKU60515.1 MAG: hypothetical protein UX82_C0010G0019 [Microgenomates group bacterium GW2011_GWE1_47_12]KKU62870.1 MAG: hypothetical protein UX84_C0001G0030 [Microgenomates group bacterium GW2011_GWD1_47_13]OGD71137.1 MAG: hypothetical protein A2187_02910 [Candidatus Collierbacteria bacterium RIFOXYA1